MGAVQSNNYVSSNRKRGIYFYKENEYNLITNNYVSLNGYGIHIDDYSNNNKIHHNNFINNTNQAYGSSASSLWDSVYPNGGNYWSDYNGTDVNKDGIGDTPYNISYGQGEQMVLDRYPLMKQNGTPQQNVTVTPGFEISWVIFSAVIIFVLKRIQL
ncbi:MAG: NosD domain-containing protein [Candidatus Methanoperedens sp.]|nr:NosD domain-containing protein [Candidatus Methanoperedens sp.]